MEERCTAMLLLFFCLHIASWECLAITGHQQPEGDAEEDQVQDGSSLIPYIWSISREDLHHAPGLPLARPRQRQGSDEPELLFAVWDSPPILAKEGLTEEEAVWVPDSKPLQTIKDNYVFGSRAFDHHFGLLHHPTVGYVSTSPPPPRNTKGSTTLQTEITSTPAPDTTVYDPYTDTPPYSEAPTPYPHTHALGISSPYYQPLEYSLSQQRRPRKYFLAGGGDDKHRPEEPARAGLFRKYYIDSTSKDSSHDGPRDINSHKPSHPHFLPAILSPAYPAGHTYQRPPPTVRQYFLLPPRDHNPHTGNLTSFDVYDKLGKSRTVGAEARMLVMSGGPKATSWVSFSRSPATTHNHS